MGGSGWSGRGTRSFVLSAVAPVDALGRAGGLSSFSAARAPCGAAASPVAPVAGRSANTALWAGLRAACAAGESAGAVRAGPLAAAVRSLRSRSKEDCVPTRESLARVRVRVRVWAWAWVQVWAWVWVWVRGWRWGGFANRSKEDCVPSRRSLSKGRLAGGDGSVGVCVVVCGDSRPPGLG